MTLPSTNMWVEFLDSLGDELDTWQPDYQGITQEQFMDLTTRQSEGLSPALFLLNKECTEIIVVLILILKLVGVIKIKFYMYTIILLKKNIKVEV